MANLCAGVGRRKGYRLRHLLDYSAREIQTRALRWVMKRAWAVMMASVVASWGR
jgi:hypothetical protein